MKKILGVICLSVLVSACSTSAVFKVPAGSKLYVHERPDPLVIDENGEATSRPFFWTAIAGIHYRLEKDNKVIKKGKLPARFRPASIFWPPYGLIYWPVGFALEEYDLTSTEQAPATKITKTGQ